MERRLAAILAADVEGYSRHTERNEEASTIALGLCRAVVEKSIADHRGRIFTSAGDGVLAEFSSVVQALRCAIEIQSEIARRNASLPEDEQMKFRIGVNLGDVVAENGNVYGTGVNVAARLEQLAEGGGICVSQPVYEQVRKILNLHFEDVGERRLKNIAEPVHVYRVLPAPLPWHARLLSHSKNRMRRPEFSALIAILFLSLAGLGSFYLRQPAILWNEILGLKGPVIAVLPFQNADPDKDEKTGRFADALTEDIITGLARSNPDWPVLARLTAFTRYKDREVDSRTVGTETGARYVVNGSVELSENKLRVRAELSSATNDGRIWGDVIERDVADVEFLVKSLQDDIAGQIVGQLGSGYGVIERTELGSARRKSDAQVDAYLRVHAAMQWDWSLKNYQTAADDLKAAISDDPTDQKALREQAWLSLVGRVFEYDAEPKALTGIIQQANSAVQRDPTDARAHMIAASAYFFAKQLDLFEYEAQQSLTLTPYDAENLAVLGSLIGNMGQWERGVDLVRLAYKLSPESAEGWYQSTMYLNYYLSGDYKSALAMIKKSPDFKMNCDVAKGECVEYGFLDFIAICGQIGLEQKKAAIDAWRKVLEIDPAASLETLEKWYRLWNFREEDIAKLMDGVRKSGVLDYKPSVQATSAEPAN